MEQIIKLTGRIAKVFPAKSGVSKQTGNKWMSQEYLLEFFSWSGARNPDRVVFRIFGEDRIKQFALKELEENVTVMLRLDAHESDGRWYNEVSATNVMRAGQQQPAQGQQQPAGGENAGQAGNQSSQQTNAPQNGGNKGKEGGDDLPF